jgi:hypothetical protein
LPSTSHADGRSAAGDEVVFGPVSDVLAGDYVLRLSSDLRASRPGMCHACHMTGFIVILLVVWLVLAILGAVLEGLFWLTVVAVVLLIGTAIYGWVKRKASDV